MFAPPINETLEYTRRVPLTETEFRNILRKLIEDGKTNPYITLHHDLTIQSLIDSLHGQIDENVTNKLFLYILYKLKIGQHELSQRREKEPPTLKQLSPIERIEGPTPEELSQHRAKEQANQINKGNQSRTRRSGYIGRMFGFGGKRNTRKRARKRSTRRLKKKVV